MFVNDFAPVTVRVIYGKVATIFRAAVEDRILTRSPCTRSIKLPSTLTAARSCR